MEAEILTDAEAAELGLPARVPGEKDAEIEWSKPRPISVELSCSKCGAKLNRTLNLSANVRVGQKIPFTCASCSGPLTKTGRRGRPRKVEKLDTEPCPESGQPEIEESVLVGARTARGSLEVSITKILRSFPA